MVAQNKRDPLSLIRLALLRSSSPSPPTARSSFFFLHPLLSNTCRKPASGGRTVSVDTAHQDIQPSILQLGTLLSALIARRTINNRLQVSSIPWTSSQCRKQSPLLDSIWATSLLKVCSCIHSELRSTRKWWSLLAPALAIWRRISQSRSLICPHSRSRPELRILGCKKSPCCFLLIWGKSLSDCADRLAMEP